MYRVMKLTTKYNSLLFLKLERTINPSSHSDLPFAMAVLPSITSAAELQNILPDCTLVSIDIEGQVPNALEVGLAICGPLKDLNSEHTYSAFLEQNMISCFTLWLQNKSKRRTKNQERLRFGKEPKNVDNEPETTISNHLEKFHSTRRILILYDSHTELKWLAQTCPNLLPTFSAQVDVQRMAVDISKPSTADVSSNRQPSLRQCLTAMSLDEGLPTFKLDRPHRACNDAVYTLAIIAAILSRAADAPPLDIATNPKRPRLFYGRPHPAKAYPFTAIIRTTDRTPLPSEIDSAGKIYNYFSSFSPITAGSGLTHKGSLNTEQLSWSWICFSNKEDLDRFQASISYTIPSRKQIRIESQYIPGVTLTAEERRVKQLEDGDRIREERRQARLKVEGIQGDIKNQTSES